MSTIEKKHHHRGLERRQGGTAERDPANCREPRPLVADGQFLRDHQLGRHGGQQGGDGAENPFAACRRDPATTAGRDIEDDLQEDDTAEREGDVVEQSSSGAIG